MITPNQISFEQIRAAIRRKGCGLLRSWLNILEDALLYGYKGDQVEAKVKAIVNYFRKPQ